MTAAPVPWALAALPAVAAAQPQYTITDLTELAAPLGVQTAQATGVSADGTAVGLEPNFGTIRGLIWRPDGTVEVLSQLPGDNSSFPNGITADGTILGSSEFAELVQCPNFTKLFIDGEATLWSLDNTPDGLADDVTGGDESIKIEQVWGMNESTQIVGWGQPNADDEFGAIGFRLEAGVVTNLGDLTRPTAINDAGTIVGYSSSGQDNALIWQKGVITNLHDAQFTGVTSRAWAITPDGVVGGEAQWDISKPEEPTIWIDAVPQRLFPEINRPQGVARGANRSGQIVGHYNDLDDLSTGWFGFIHQDGETTDLFDLLVDLDGWEQLLPLAIGDSGHIVGHGVRNGQLGKAFLMTPVCPADVNDDGELNVLDFVAFQGLFAAGDEAADCNGDGLFNVLDFVCFQGLFAEGCE